MSLADVPGAAPAPFAKPAFDAARPAEVAPQSRSLDQEINERRARVENPDLLRQLRGL